VVLVAHSNYILQHSTIQSPTVYFYVPIVWYTPICTAMRSKAKVYGRLTTGIAGLNTADGIVVSGLLCVLSVVYSATCWFTKYRLVLTCVRLIVCDPEASTMRQPGLELGCCVRRKNTSKLHIDSKNKCASYVNINPLPLMGLN
jgi:hypothetical protein